MANQSLQFSLSPLLHPSILQSFSHSSNLCSYLFIYLFISFSLFSFGSRITYYHCCCCCCQVQGAAAGTTTTTTTTHSPPCDDDMDSTSRLAPYFVFLSGELPPLYSSLTPNSFLYLSALSSLYSTPFRSFLFFNDDDDNDDDDDGDDDVHPVLRTCMRNCIAIG